MRIFHSTKANKQRKIGPSKLKQSVEEPNTKKNRVLLTPW